VAHGRKQRWNDLSREQRSAILGAGLVQLALLGAALSDLSRRPSAGVNGPKAVWVASSFVNFVGPLAYFAFGRRGRS